MYKLARVKHFSLSVGYHQTYYSTHTKSLLLDLELYLQFLFLLPVEIYCNSAGRGD